MLNKKGTVLVVAITAMMIILIIGAICLQIYVNQNLLDTFDQVKARTFYSAEGAVEMMRAYIQKQTNDNLTTNGDTLSDNRGFLVDVTPFKEANVMTDWEPFKAETTSNFPKPILVDSFDGTMHPSVNVAVLLHRLTSGDKTRVKTEGKINFKDGEADIYANTPLATSDYGRVFRGYEIVATASAVHKTALGINTISTTLRYYFYTRRVNTGSAESPYYKNEIKWVGWRID